MSEAASSGSPVDFVIMWVDGSDPETIRAREEAVAECRAASIPLKDTPNRHRDNGELVFLLRSIEAFMPWYRRIVLVTNGQRPGYIDFSSDRIRLVTHADIFPPGVGTPSFNTYAIDSCTSRIDGLSETYVRFSDDFLVGRPVSKREFLGLDGLGQNLVGASVFNIGSGQYVSTLQNNAVSFWRALGYMPLSNFLHVPQLRHRSTMAELAKVFPEWLAETRSNRFRNVSDMNLLFLYPYFSLFQKRRSDLAAIAMNRQAPGMIDVNRLPNLAEVYMQIQVGDKSDWRAALNRVSRKPPRFFNINDDLGDEADEKDRRYVGQQLYRLFPKPSPFETRPETFPGYAALRSG